MQLDDSWFTEHLAHRSAMRMMMVCELKVRVRPRY